MVTLRGTNPRAGARIARPLAGFAAAAVALLAGGVVGHALTTSATALVSAANPSVYGQSVTFTATITPSSPAPTGSVTFQDGGVNISGCVNRGIAAGAATCTVAAFTTATHSVTATYGGSGVYAGSTSSPVAQVVNAGGTSTAVVSSANPSVSGQTVTYTATVSATAPASGKRTGTVDFEDGGATISGCGAKAVSTSGSATCAAPYTGPGSHSITAVYSGDANFTGSTSGALVQTVNQGATSTALASSVNPSSTGANVTFTATVTANSPASGTRTGTVEFEASGVDIAGCGAQAVASSGKATCVTNALAVGATSITALYSGDVNFTGSESAVLTQVVNQGATSTAVVSSRNPSSTGVNVTFTATVKATSPASGTRTGTVDFQDGGVDIPGCAAQAVSAAGTATCLTNTLAAGSHSITATYSGDANFITSTSAPLTQTVLSTTSTVVTSNANPSVYGQSVQYTATVTGGPVVAGTITFRDGSSNIAGCVAVPVAAGAASCTTTPAFGSRTITAVYSGDSADTGSTSPSLTQVVGADSTTTVVTPTVNPSVHGQSVTFTATVTANAPGSGTPTGKVAFESDGAGISGCGNVTMTAGAATCTTASLSVGSHSIVAVYKGATDDLTSTSAADVMTVDPGVTSTTVVSSGNPLVNGQAVTYTATVIVIAPAVGTPTGQVAFDDAGIAIAGCSSAPLSGAGTATCTVTHAPAGTHTISAVYAGDANFSGSSSPDLTETVGLASTSATVASGVDPAVTGQAVTLTATVTVVTPGWGTPTGTVDFQDDGADIAGCNAEPLSGTGTATCTASFPDASAHPITAVYSGDSGFSGSISPAVTETVDPGSTGVTVSSAADPSVPGQMVTYTATVAALAPAAGVPTGTVTFMDAGTTIGGCAAQPLVAATTSCAVVYTAAGPHSITALYSGDPDFSTSTSSGLTQTVDQGATDTVVGSSVNPSVAGQGLTFTATITTVAPASGAPTGTVTFMDGVTVIGGCAAQPESGGAASCAVTFAGVGTHAVTAVYNGDANFSGSTSPILTQTIGQGSTTVALASSPQGVVVAGYAVTFTATIAPAGAAGGVPTGSVAFMDGTAPIPGCGAQAVAGGVAQCTVSYAGAGVHMVSAVYGGDQDFAGSTSPSVAMTVSSDPLVPDTGAGSTQTVLSGLAIAGGLLLLILGTFVRRRSRSAA